MRTTLLSLSLLSTALIACSDDPPSPSDVRARIATDLHYVLTEGKTAMDGSTASMPTGAAFGFATATLEQARLAAPLSRLFVTAKDRNLSLDGDEETDFDPDAIVDFLNQELFTDANHIGNGIYRVPASLVCTETVYDDTTNTTQEVIDPECAANLAKADVRVRVADDDGLRFWLQLDANHDEPLGILLRHDEIAVTVNLDDATDAMIALAQAFGEQAPNADLSGQVTGSVKIHGQGHAAASIAFDRAISIKFAEQGVGLDSDGAFRFASAAGDIIAIELDGNAPKADFDLGLGLTTVHVPADEFDPSTDVVLGGATVDAMFQANTLTLNNISLGNQTTSVTTGGVPSLTVDLNANDGRKLDATIVVDQATGSETLTVSPRLDLQTFSNDEEGPYSVTRVQLDGSLRGFEGSDVTEVVSGSFAITTNPAQYGFSATAGQCVTATDIYDEETYTSWTQYSVGACL
jgi:hypothetical protein